MLNEGCKKQQVLGSYLLGSSCGSQLLEQVLVSPTERGELLKKVKFNVGW